MRHCHNNFFSLSRLLLIAALALLSACAPAGHLLIKEADLQQIELRMQEQEQVLHHLSRQQADHRHAQSEAYYAAMELHFETLHELRRIAEQQGALAERQKEMEELVRSRSQASRSPDVGRSAARSAVPSAAVARPGEKQVVGAVEKVFLSPPGTLLPARIDTGATTSSLDARDIEKFERNGERWVRFTMIDPEDGRRVVLECRLARNVRIIAAAAEESERRPVVELGVVVGNSTQTAQFTLSDRRHLEYPVLIGRNILRDIMVVDVSRSHIAPPVIDPDSENPRTP